MSLPDFFRDDRGPNLVEYALLLSVVVFALIAAFVLQGGKVYTFWVPQIAPPRAAGLMDG